uniref:SH3 domain-containing protein n=1 Tax=Ditylenchus dipsaci TaxID=166011 RepID=A0A915CWP4_9BILA
MRWKGRLQKKPELEGWFPKSYIKVAAETNVSTNSDPKTAKTKSVNAQKSVEKAVVSPVANGSQGENWYIALYQFDAVESTDLSLKIGDRILVLEAKDEWWKGTSGGRTGIFPANYVQKADSGALVPTAGESIGRAVAAFEATAANQISLRMGDLVRIHSTSAGGWWEGEVDRDGNKVTGWFPGNYVQVITEPNASSNGASVNSSKSSHLASAVFDYEAQHVDELSFKQGELIESGPVGCAVVEGAQTRGAY